MIFPVSDMKPDHRESCAICGCVVHRGGDYATPTREGRSHATSHHYVAERFFGRSGNRPGQTRERIFQTCPWGLEGRTAVYCYECHEELLHNPVLLPEDVRRFARLVALRRLNETDKPEGRETLGGRIELLHKVLEVGIESLLKAAENEGTLVK